MKAATVLALACLLPLASCKKEVPPSAAPAASPPPITVTGEVFIRTNGGETVKLSGQEIAFYPEDVLTQAVIAAKEAAAADPPAFDAELEKSTKNAADLNKLIDKGIKLTLSIDPGLDELHRAELAYIETIKSAKNSWPTAAYIFDTFPKSEHKVRTNSDGKFTIELPNGSWVATSTATRQTGGKKQNEYYYWAVTLQPSLNLMLDNSNLVTSDSDESAIHCRLGFFEFK